MNSKLNELVRRQKELDPAWDEENFLRIEVSEEAKVTYLELAVQLTEIEQKRLLKETKFKREQREEAGGFYEAHPEYLAPPPPPPPLPPFISGH